MLNTIFANKLFHLMTGMMQLRISPESSVERNIGGAERMSVPVFDPFIYLEERTSTPV